MIRDFIVIKDFKDQQNLLRSRTRTLEFSIKAMTQVNNVTVSV